MRVESEKPQPSPEFASVGEWYEAMKAEGYSVPLQLCQALSLAMKQHDLSLPDALMQFWLTGKLIPVGKTYIFDLSALEELRRSGGAT
jgi:hypothetical protein